MAHDPQFERLGYGARSSEFMCLPPEHVSVQPVIDRIDSFLLWMGTVFQCPRTLKSYPHQVEDSTIY